MSTGLIIAIAVVALIVIVLIYVASSRSQARKREERREIAETVRIHTEVTGARPLAVTDNLNFGNPQKPEIMGQIVHAIEGMAEACREMAFPVISGNVSLYNETNGIGIPPTPAIGGVGVIQDIVPNHIGSGHPWMRDLPTADWVYARDGQWAGTPVALGGDDPSVPGGGAAPSTPVTHDA